MFADDPVRAESLSLSFENILFDFSKQRITNDTLDLLLIAVRRARPPLGLLTDAALLIANHRRP